MAMHICCMKKSGFIIGTLFLIFFINAVAKKKEFLSEYSSSPATEIKKMNDADAGYSESSGEFSEGEKLSLY